MSFDPELQDQACQDCDPLLLPAFGTYGISFQFNVTSELDANFQKLYVGICTADCDKMIDDDIEVEQACKWIKLKNQPGTSSFNIQDPSTWQTNADGVPIITINNDDGLEPDENQFQIPFGTYTQEQLFDLLSTLLGFEVTEYEFQACCAIPNLSFQVVDPEDPENLQIVVGLFQYWDLAIVHYPETPILLPYDHCFRYCILDQSKNIVACSNLFQHIQDNCYTTAIKYYNKEDSFGFRYPHDEVYNRILLPFWIRFPEYPLTEKIQRLQDGTYNRISSNIEKEYPCITDYMPEWAHDRMVIALKHDVVIATAPFAKIQEEAVMVQGGYNTDWQDENLCDAQAKFKMKRNFNGINSNCRPARATCCELSDPITWDPSILETYTPLADNQATMQFDITNINPQVTEYMLAVFSSAEKRNLLYNGDFEALGDTTYPIWAGWYSTYEHIKILGGKLVYDYAITGTADHKGSELVQGVILKAGRTYSLSVKYQADKPFTGKLQVYKNTRQTIHIIHNDLIVEKSITFAVDPLWQTETIEFVPAVDSEYLVRLVWDATDGDDTGIQFDDFTLYDTQETVNTYLTTTILATANPSITFNLDNLVPCKEYNYGLYGKVNCQWQFLKMGSFQYQEGDCGTIDLQAVTEYVIGDPNVTATFEAELCGTTYLDELEIELTSISLEPLITQDPIYYNGYTETEPMPGASPFSDTTGFALEDPGTIWGYRARVKCSEDTYGPWSRTVYIKIIAP